MRHKLLSLAIPFFLITHGYAQITSGTVTYQEILRRETPQGIDRAEAEMFERMVPKEMKSEKILRFTSTASLYTANNKKVEEPASYEERNENGMVNRVTIARNRDEKCFTDLATGKQTRQTELLGRVFLVSSERTSGWKITGKQKEILGHPCQEAILERDSAKTVAWFTSDIPVSTGPSSWNGLPGLVLAVETDNGRLSVVATAIQPGDVAAVDLTPPGKGKKVTEEEFRRLIAEHRQEMRMNGGRGQMIRVVRD
jgi:GLPGLI family protein